MILHPRNRERDPDNPRRGRGIFRDLRRLATMSPDVAKELERKRKLVGIQDYLVDEIRRLEEKAEVCPEDERRFIYGQIQAFNDVYTRLFGTEET